MKKIKKDTVVRRLYARGKWKLESVAHFGGENIGVADMCLLRDAEGKLFIPGASIAGVARSFLARQIKSSEKYKAGHESSTLKRFFGGDMRQQRQQADKNRDTMSALIVADATCVSEQVKTSIRDGVRVDANSGTAVKGAKYDIEVIERGTEFELYLECIIRSGNDQPSLKEGATKPNFEDLFLALLYGFQQGAIRLGARTRRGYGCGKVASWKIADLRMNCREDVSAWLSNEPWSRSTRCLNPQALPFDRRRSFGIEAHFELHTSLLIRSVSGDPKAPDMVHLQSNGEPVVPGTSFAGAFRHRAALIAKTIGWSDEVVDKMFGYVKKKKGNNTQQADARASRVWIEEHLVKNVKTRWQHRVAIDRFTGGSLQGALFNEKPIYPMRLDELTEEELTSNLQLTLTLEEPKKSEIGLLLLTLRDFWHGNAVLGGEVSSGRGVLRGVKAELQMIPHTSSDTKDPEVWEFIHKHNRMQLVEGEMEITELPEFLRDCVSAAQCCDCSAESPESIENGESTNVQ